MKYDARLAQPLGHRAIHVVYWSPFEQFGNYALSLMPERYDAFLFLDPTLALHSLAIHPAEKGEPDLSPWGE